VWFDDLVERKRKVVGGETSGLVRVGEVSVDGCRMVVPEHGRNVVVSVHVVVDRGRSASGMRSCRMDVLVLVAMRGVVGGDRCCQV